MSESDALIRRPDEASGSSPKEGRRERKLLLLVAAAFVLISLGLFGSFLFGPPGRIASSFYGDGAVYFVFMRSFGAEQLLKGNIPLWNPHTFSGLPFVGVFQSAMFYPLNVIYLFLPLGTALNCDFALHLFLLGFLTFAWLRGWGLHPVGAFFAAMMVTLSAPNFLRILAGQVTVLGTLAWSPLLLLAIDKLSERPCLDWSLAGIFATTLMLLAGHPPTCFMAGFVTALYSLLLLFRSSSRLRFVLWLIPVVVVPPLLTAVQVFTGLKVGGEGIRAGGMTYEFATSFSFPPENLLTLLVPFAFGNADSFMSTYWGRWFYWDASAYLGLIGLTLAIHGTERGRSNQQRIALLLFPLIIIIALGCYTPLYKLLYHVPGFAHFRSPSKFMFYAALFGSALAGIGVDRLLSEERRVRAAVIGASLLAVLLLVGALWVHLSPPDVPDSLVRRLASLNVGRVYEQEVLERWQTVLLKGFLLSAFVFVVVSVLLWFGRGRRWVVWLLIVLGGLELFTVASANRGGTWVDADYRRRPSHANRGGKWVLVEHKQQPNLPEIWSAAGDDRILIAGMTSNTAMQSHGYDVWGYDPVVLLRYAEFMAFTQERRVDDLNLISDNYAGLFHGNHPNLFHPLLSMLRGRFMVSESGEIVEYSDPAPRFLLVRDYRVLEERASILEAMQEPGFDPRRMVILEEAPEPAPTPGGTGGVVKILDESTDHLTLEVELDDAAILLITDAYAEGWLASGLPGSIQSDYQLLPGNYVLRAIPMRPGRHYLRVEYSPLAYRVGAWTSSLTALVLLVAVVLWYRQGLRTR